VSEHIGDALRTKEDYFVVCIRSTVFPGTVENVIIPLLNDISGKCVGKDFGVCMIPEFLREGTSVKDFFSPPKHVIGEYDKKSGDVIENIFANIDAPMIRTDIKSAEMVKYADNTFHALKVTFANEIGNICKALEMDSHKVMDIFCKDYKLNLSPYYLKPGFAFGGSCLPKDVRAITYESRIRDVDTPVLNTILESNRKQILNVIRKLLEYKGRTLGFMGLSFKGGTDDLRESPIVEVIETMIGKGFSVKIYDRYVSIARLIGSNREYIEKEIPHISSIMCNSVRELIDNSDVIVIGNQDDEFQDALINYTKSDHTVFDLVRIIHDSGNIKGQYYGICW
jgi:GDP-mannose 6-dehydrogenase